MIGPDDVLAFWLGELNEQGRADDEHQARWWRKSSEFDAECRARFEEAHAALCAGQLEGWRETPRGAVAYVIMIDQLSRNMFRGSAQMYDEDPRAAEAARAVIAAGDDAELAYHERYFLYMPLMHAEDLALQEECVAAFERLKADHPQLKANADKAIEFAVRHRDIVARFGRFPHRNALLSRESTPEEVRFLEEPGSSF